MSTTPDPVTGIYFADMRPNYNEFRVGVETTDAQGLVSRHNATNDMVARRFATWNEAEAYAMKLSEEYGVPTAQVWNETVPPLTINRDAITNTGVAMPALPSPQRSWQIEWKIPEWVTVGTLSEVMESVRGYGTVWIAVTDEGLPKVFRAMFVTTPEWNEFDLSDALRDTAVSFDLTRTAGVPGDGFPTRPAEVFGTDSSTITPAEVS